VQASQPGADAAWNRSPPSRDGQDLTSLKHARTHIHRRGRHSDGGLDAVVAFTDESSASFAARGNSRGDALAAAKRSSVRASRELLDELVNGAMPVPLKLFPSTGDAARARCQSDIADRPFYPDLGLRAPNLGTPQVIPAAKLPSYMVKQRRLYQRGLPSWLRGTDDGEGARRCATP
jgi:hypothetical protein